MLFALSPLSKRNTATNADGCVTTCIFQGATEDVLLRLEKRKKPLCCTDCCVVAVQKGVHTHQDRRATVHIRSVGLPGSAWDMAVMGAAGASGASPDWRAACNHSPAGFSRGGYSLITLL